jgi:ribosomal protein L11 methyltransferase
MNGPSDPVQIVARGPRAEAEAAASAIDADPRLEGSTYSILEEDEDRGVWRIDAFPTEPAEADAFQAVLGGFPGLSVGVEILADADWLAMALSGLPPVRAGRFFVYGVHDRGRRPPNAVNLRIEAGAAFGTGHHGTTVGCLLAYDALLRRARFRRVLDVGAGTGVLAIAAARTGSLTALGTDIDPVSVRIARENAALNQAPARFVHAAGLSHPAVRAAAPYDLVFANILAGPLVALAPQIVSAARPGARIILSGLLRPQARRVRAAYLNRGCRLERTIKRDAWATLVLRRPPSPDLRS